jgi:predicted phage terminase large subunit-like protein
MNLEEMTRPDSADACHRAPRDEGPTAEAEAAPRQYCPHRPWPKQQLFLDLPCKEAFYGGAAGGGKSDALLMAALQHVHVPGYAALILRKDTQRLKLAGGLITRSHEWLALTDARWHQQDKRWTFPTRGAAATISFGYLRDRNEKYRYGSSEYQYIAFDELTEFPEEDYLFLFSRLRKRKEIDVPLRMRSASNPGNLGHGWVLQRFIPNEARAGETTSDVYWKDGIAYVPARIRDNPALDELEYSENLMHLPTVERQRLMHGDWSIREEGVLRAHWLQRYDTCDQRLDLLDAQNNPFAHVDERQCYRFVTIDPAGTSADRAKQQRGRPASWTVIQVWDLPPGKLQRYMLLRHVVRERMGFDQLCHHVKRVYAEWRPKRMYIEGEKLGQAVVDHLGRELPIDTIRTAGDDKLTRAAPLIVRLERGEVFVPRGSTPWIAPLESEWLGWTGGKDEVCDQIDAAAYAAIIADERQHSVIKAEPISHL